MGIQDGKTPFLELLLVCLLMLSSVSTSTVDDGVSKGEIIISVQKVPIFSPDYSQFHPTHDKAVPKCSLHGLSCAKTKQKHRKPRSGRVRRSASESLATEAEDGSLDRRRELYNEFLRKVLRKGGHEQSEKEKDTSKSVERTTKGIDATSTKTTLKPSPTPSTRIAYRSTASERVDQTIKTDLQSKKATLPTPKTRRAFTLSPEQRELRRQILIKRNKEERLQRLRELYRRQKGARGKKSSTKPSSVSKTLNHSSRPRLSKNGKRHPRQKHKYHKKESDTEKVTRPTSEVRKNIGGTPKSQENLSNPGKGQNKGRGNVSVPNHTTLDNNASAIKPTKGSPSISAPHANDYLTRLDSVAERKKYPRRAILKGKTKEKTDSSTLNTPISKSSRSKSKQSPIQHEEQLKQKKNGNRIESTSGAKLTPHGRSEKSGSGRKTRISKKDKKRIRQIRKNRLKLRERKRRNNRKRKHRNRKGRTRHKMSSPNPTSIPFIMTSTSQNQISSTAPNSFSSTMKRLQRKNDQEQSTASLFSTTPNRNASFITTSESLERSNESQKVSNAPRDLFTVNRFNDEAVIKDMQVTSEPDPPVNTDVPVGDTTSSRDEEVKRSGERYHTSTNSPQQTDPLNLSPKATAASSLPAQASTANVLEEVSIATNGTHMPLTRTVTLSDVRNSPELSNGNANMLYNASVGRNADDENREFSDGNANQLFNTSIWSEAYNENYPINETVSSTLNNATKAKRIQGKTNVGISSTESLLNVSTTSSNIVTSSVQQVSNSTTLSDKDRSTDVTKMATPPLLPTSSNSSNPSLHQEGNNSSTVSQSENQFSSMALDNQTSIVYGNSDNDNNNSTYTQISSSTSFSTEVFSSSTSSTTTLSSSISESKTTTNPYASRWIAWAKRRRKKSKNRAKSSTKSSQPSGKSGGIAHGSVALALAKAEQENLNQLTSSRRPVTEPTTTKGPFIGYKTAYDFLSNQKGVKVSVLNENRRESRDINKFMGENMCEIFNKHYVPTRIGGKCV